MGACLQNKARALHKGMVMQVCARREVKRVRQQLVDAHILTLQ